MTQPRVWAQRTIPEGAQLGDVWIDCDPEMEAAEAEVRAARILLAAAKKRRKALRAERAAESRQR